MRVVPETVRLFGCLLSAQLVLFVAIASAESMPVCIGYDSIHERWGMLFNEQKSLEQICPEGMAVVSHQQQSSNYQLPEANCCPLPADALLPEHHWVIGRCPEGSVVTGGRVDTLKVEGSRIEFRCTRINQAKFTLSSEATLLRLDTMNEVLTSLINILGVHSIEITSLAKIPVELRYGITRVSRTRWTGGCIGYPWGSLLVERGPDGCDGSSFRELLTKDGERLTMNCRTVSGIFDPQASCIEYAE